MLHKIVWENLEGFGYEFLKLSKENDEFIARGTIITSEQNNPYNVNYIVHLDQTWNTKKLMLDIDGKPKLEIISDGVGNWSNDHRELNELEGAIDIDISATPFSNSLPINRYDWVPNQQRDFQMVYISVPTLEMFKIPQSYTFLQRDEDLRVFLYQCRDFESKIYVDDHGFVNLYPGLFKRNY
ncbi:putative glycolipid-binding domain-containing protein [Filobacillus milosensis]|uniref:putative glycolipid-binding domain-containing protein n=1 Tax=Filobacillus milosensis TaxID=94137 RepID=UPI0018912FB8|nr:putative glycolipid-binding domain-containing protein [Filobacillus milosensis]